MKRFLKGAAVVVGIVIGTGATASAIPDPNATNPSNATGGDTCEAWAVVDGRTIDPYASSGVFTIPLSGSATYHGAVDAPDGERQINGHVVILTPPGIPDITLTDRWTWDGTANRTFDDGSVDWDLPSVLPRGVPLTVEGFHREEGIDCSGSIEVQIEGGAFDSLLTPISLIGTVGTAAGLAFAARPKGIA